MNKFYLNVVASVCFVFFQSIVFSQCGSSLASGDFDCDGVINSVDGDDDNDGILDVNEQNCAFGSVAAARSGFSGAINTFGSAPVSTLNGDTWTDMNAVVPGATFPPSLPLESPPVPTGTTGTFNVTFDGSLQTEMYMAIANIDASVLDIFNENNVPLKFTLLEGDPQTGVTVSGGSNTTITNRVYDTNLSANSNGLSATGVFKVTGNFVSLKIVLTKVINNAGDGFLISFSNINCTSFDTDGDGISNSYDTDSDGDGCSDANEAYLSSTAQGTDGNMNFGNGNPPSINSDGTVSAASYSPSTITAYNANAKTAHDITLISPPSNQTVASGAAANFTVAANVKSTTTFSAGAPNYSASTPVTTGLSYQWYLGNPASGGTLITNGGVYSGATTATLTISNSTGLNGNQYFVQVLHTSLVCPETASATLTFSCLSSTNAPTLSATDISNVCPATSINLTSIFSSNTPASTVLTWHTGTPATTANKVLTPTSVSAGTYYAAFYDAAIDCYSGVNGDGSATSMVTGTVNSCGTIQCSQTQIIPAPVAGTPGQLTLVVSVNVSSAGCFPLTVSGSGFSLANGITNACTNTTGIQNFNIPLSYDGSALGTLNFTVGAAGSCSANLTLPSTSAIIPVWTLDCVPSMGPILH